jgi:BirA family biotin operon repressor/biotin-[acetyl-CoA-carboxylase] ligase
MLAAVAARQSVSALGVHGIGIKWPNDIIVNGKKLAGLLVHARHGPVNWATVGLGVNLGIAPDLGADATLSATAISELSESGSPESWRFDLTIGFVTAINRALAAPESALDDWRRHLIHRPGDTLAVRLASGEVITGSFLGLTPDGFLRLDHKDGERVISGGDVIETG